MLLMIISCHSPVYFRFVFVFNVLTFDKLSNVHFISANYYSSNKIKKIEQWSGMPILSGLKSVWKCEKDFLH